MLFNLLSNCHKWIEAVASLVYPEVCQVCKEERATPVQGFVGRGCRSKVHPIQPPFCMRCGLPFPGEIGMEFECSNCTNVPLHFTYARSAVPAKDVVLDVIHRYKYQRALWFEPFLVELFLEAALPALKSDRWNLIVPVPLHPSRQNEREFNQAEHLAHSLGKAIGIDVNNRALIRIQATPTQTHLTREERARNVRNAFAMRKRADVRGARIIVVDDVLTTGATTNACARTLRKAGAEEVCVWTVARGMAS